MLVCLLTCMDAPCVIESLLTISSTIQNIGFHGQLLVVTIWLLHQLWHQTASLPKLISVNIGICVNTWNQIQFNIVKLIASIHLSQHLHCQLYSC